MEIEILQQVTASMWVMFGLGVLVIFLYSLKVEEDASGLKGFFKLTIKNALFHIVASLVVLLLLKEISAVLIEAYIPFLKDSGMYQGTLSFLSGLGGSVLIAWAIQGIKNRFKKE